MRISEKVLLIYINLLLKSCLPVVCHQKIREFEKRLMITCCFGAGEGN
jgi:hypothetical protein